MCCFSPWSRYGWSRWDYPPRKQRLGIFEQIFGLIRCPLWRILGKIKFINLRIIGESSLAPGTLMKPAITFEPSDLEAFYNINTLCGQ